MTALTIRLPESLHQSIKELARREGISVNQFIASAAGEKMAAVATADYLRREAEQGNRHAFDHFLAAVPDRTPEPGDEWDSNETQ
ncbi:toxin-antitoxin system HicB family antitoxin [Endothiovibrio diazotrophicus]